MSHTAIASVDAAPQGGRLLLSLIVFILFVALIAATVFCAWVFNQRMERFYEGFIYPNVHALGLDLGGMTLVEAQTALAARGAQTSVGDLILRGEAQQWALPWTEAGLALDAAATAQAAYAVGRGAATLREQLTVWLALHEITPIYTVDLEKTRVALEQLSLQISRLPVEASIGLENGRAVVLPGTPGRMLDVTAMLGQLTALPIAQGQPAAIDLVFRDVYPLEPDTSDVQAQAELLLNRQIELSAYDVLTDATLRWTLGRADFAPWLRLVEQTDKTIKVEVNPTAVPATLERLAAGTGDGRGFRLEEATRQILEAFNAGGGSIELYLTHAERVYTVQSGDILGRIAARFGMPPGLIVEANRGVDLNILRVGQQIIIPSQDILTPYLVTPGKKIVVSLVEQHVRVYENGALIHEWLTSTGQPDSPTAPGIFQVISKEPEAYASQWDLLMPYFMGVYVAGGGVTNGFHELPILSNGQRLWAGNLGHPASFGCIILGIPEAETLYNWAEIGTLVVIE